jgi:hypothetical protein
MSAIDAVRQVVGEADAVIARLRAALVDPAVVLDPVAVVERVMHAELEARPVVFGGGFVVAPERLGQPLMAWWQATGAARDVRRLDAGATGGGYVRSYEELEWYRVPADTGAPHMTGPYVDLLCTDQATLTFTAPLVVDGAFAGVVGADVTVPAFERAVGTALRSAGEGALVVTTEGRVAASTDPSVLVQRRVRDDVLARYAVEQVPGSRLAVAVPRP